jgi:hypothetical protein
MHAQLPDEGRRLLADVAIRPDGTLAPIRVRKMYVPGGLIFTALVAGVLYLLRDLFEKGENPSRSGDTLYSDENTGEFF